MAKTDAIVATGDVAAAVAEPTASAEFPLSLSEFCTRLSASDKRVELIGAFEHAERVAGRESDLESIYTGRYAAFATQPA